MRAVFNIACVALMFAGGVGGNLLDGWPSWVAYGVGVAALAAFLISTLGGGGGPPGKLPGERPPPIRFGGGTLPG